MEFCEFTDIYNATLGACSHESEGAQAGEVPHPAGVTNLSIKFLFFPGTVKLDLQRKEMKKAMRNKHHNADCVQQRGQQVERKPQSVSSYP